MAGIKSIIDIELIEMSKEVYLYVLHLSEFDKITSTSAKQNVAKLSIFQFHLENNESTDLVYLYSIDNLSYYSRNIIK